MSFGIDRFFSKSPKRTIHEELPHEDDARIQGPSPSAPVLRWLGDWPAPKKKNRHNRSHSDIPAPRSSPSPSSSAPSTPGTPPPNLAALQEALSESLPKFPPIARLPESFRPASTITRPPPFFDNLTRSTLPTASLFPPPSESDQSVDIPPLANPNDLPPVVLNSPPKGSSLNSLRRLSLREREPSGHSQSGSLLSKSSPPTRPASPTGWWWFQPQNKGDVDALLEEEDRAHTLQQERSHLSRKYRTPKNPLVFCHGLLGFDSVKLGPAIAPLEVTHWRGIKEVLEANGAEVLITRVPATSSPIERAKVLEEKISQTYPGRSVHLIGGGIDCRYLTSRLKHRKFDVLSVTTIASPHRGSSFADHFLSTVGTRMPSVLSLLDLLPNGGGDGKAFECLTIEAMRKFNEETPDVPGVKYFSWGATYNPGFIDTWKYPHSVVLEKEGPNDGLVSIESAKWGTYLGTLEDVNHLDLVGWINTARYKWAEIVGKEIKFRPATFYLAVADMLAGEVEGQPKLAGQEEGPSGAGGSAAGKGAVVKDTLEQEGKQGIEEGAGKDASGGPSCSGIEHSGENALSPSTSRNTNEDESNTQVESRRTSGDHDKRPER
ncbi:hypothetical protein PC9H_003450 [Pleurotus ostreatus]|uniref:Triacylglycerol lipase n=1 Tax=Pleurotus ostreatus TaxID=5322 RepID=A0A8H7A101_PLEOS|nr:uncharacterized protein PC9H_003450 [Pleurotus ostreatus]KAF7436617.1 hypothetical protein PC9H_003450 [Pleurotus ostreatus]